MAQLPDKVPGQHRWIASAAYVLTEEQARSAMPDQEVLVLSPSLLMSFGVGCWDCEEEYSAVVGLPCRAVEE